MKYSGLNISKDVLNVDIFAKQLYNEQLRQFIYCYLFIVTTWPVAEQLLLNKWLATRVYNWFGSTWIEVLNNVQLYVHFDWFTCLHLKPTDAWSVVLFSLVCASSTEGATDNSMTTNIVWRTRVDQRIRIASHENVWLPEQRPIVG